MAGDDLHDPLGLDRRRRNWRLPFRSIFLVSLGAALLAGFGWLHFYGNPSGGEPQAVATITPDAAIVPASAATVMPARRHDAREPEKAGVATTTIEDAADLERKSGVKVIRAGGGTAPAVTIIEVPRALDVTLAPAPDPRLVEPSR
ncbi:MAG: divergent polysaccharide deacetylase family protein, partial [Methylovirgula sp.]